MTAGLGAGWSTEEFAALGLELPPFRTRMDRLEEVLRLARGLYDHGAVTLEGTHIVARDLPLSPVPKQPPALLVGGGSDRVLRMAGRYADVLDLHGDPRHGQVAGATMAEAVVADVRRRALTTVADLGAPIELVRSAAQDAGRPRDAASVSTQIWFTAFGSADDVRAAEQDLCANWAGITFPAPRPQPLPALRARHADGGGPARAARSLRARPDLARRRTAPTRCASAARSCRCCPAEGHPSDHTGSVHRSRPRTNRPLRPTTANPTNTKRPGAQRDRRAVAPVNHTTNVPDPRHRGRRDCHHHRDEPATRPPARRAD